MIPAALFVVTALAVVACARGIYRERADWNRLPITDRRARYLAAEAKRSSG